MPRKTRHSWNWIPLFAGAAFTIFLALDDNPGRGQVAKDGGGQGAAIAPKPTPLASPSTNCRQCHTKGDYPPEQLALLICRMTEMQFYDKGDKHQLAYKQLEDDRSKRIVELLGFKDEKGKPVKDATTVKECLRCHALPEVEGTPTTTAVLKEGVTCVACHGAFQEWISEHQNPAVLSGLQFPEQRPKNAPKGWIDFTRQEKEKLKGMTDLWEPVRRVEVCASCHIGNVKEKKILTHAMYAAGHPPLPSFEPASFSDLQPKHWQYLREKNKAQGNRLKPLFESNLERAELVAVSGPILLRESMTLFAPPAVAGWPDFARYDCRACHHELKSDTKDAPPSQPFAPGRPSEAKWIHALVRVGITGLTATPEAAEKELKSYESHFKDLRKAMSAEPFGSGGDVARAAAALMTWADNLVKNRPESGVDQARAWKLLPQLCDEAAAGGLDYDTARQLAWAFRAIYHDLIPDTKKNQRNPEIVAILKQLEDSLFMDLNAPTEKAPVEDSLAGRLDRASQFDRAATAKLFTQLKALVVRH